MPAGHRRDPAKERRWRSLVAEQGRSDLTIEAFCQTQGLASSAFHFWKRELRARDAQRRSFAAARAKANAPSATRPRFLPVRLADSPATSSACSASLELALPGGELLRVPAGFDPATLAQVLSLLRGE